MKPFLDKVLEDVQRKDINIEKACFVFPNKRSSMAFRSLLLAQTKRPFFAPRTESIDSFIIRISGLKEIKNSRAQLKLFSAYCSTNKQTNKNIQTFSDWGGTFINDTIEIEQNLLDAQVVLKELAEINKIKNWGENNIETDLFWEQLPKLYEDFKKKLIDNQEGTKGICYSEAQKNLEHYKETNKNTQHVFIGLNALSKSEELIIKELLSFNQGEIYWDIDRSFMDNKNHGAAHFIKKYKNSWDHYIRNPFNWVSEEFKGSKTISIIEATKSIGQAKEIGEILFVLNKDKLKKVAVILGDETIIEPVLNHLPSNIKDISIGSAIPSSMLELKKLLKLTLERQLNNLKIKTNKQTDSILSSRIIRTASQDLNAENKNILLSLILKKWKSPAEALDNLICFVEELSLNKSFNETDLKESKLILEILSESKTLIKENKNINNIKALKDVLVTFLDEIHLPYESDIVAMTQIMGLLETRALDFETVIISSVNEGFLPKSKSFDSLIPFDLRKKYKLLTFNERDKTNTYHFYRLLQRAKNIYLIYNGINEGIKGGEKSRLIHQLEMEGLDNHQLIYKRTTPNLSDNNDEREIAKSPRCLELLKQLAISGFSPSSLEAYLKDPEDFYYSKVHKLNSNNDEEESISSRIVGLIFHESIEELYKPLVNKTITTQLLGVVLNKIEGAVKSGFVNNHELEFNSGKNLIAFEVIKNAIKKFVLMEMEDLKKGNTIKIMALEQRISQSIEISELNYPVKLKGVIDRVDIRNETIRIIDYKTGLMNSGDLKIKHPSTLCNNSSQTKAMQLMCYSSMYLKSSPSLKGLEAGIISLRDLNSGLMKLTVNNTTEKTSFINVSHIDEFEKGLKKLILEMMSSETPFSTPSSN
jgi:ATP-dependent helicase/nuclease subunit B